jgi:hypothetical protein
MHVPEISDRYGLLLEVYLRGCEGHMAELQKQNQVLKHLVRAANLIKGLKEHERRDSMIAELEKIKFPSKFQLPLNPKYETGRERERGEGEGEGRGRERERGEVGRGGERGRREEIRREGDGLTF